MVLNFVRLQFIFRYGATVLISGKYDVFGEEKNTDGFVAHLRLSGQDRSDGAVGSAQGA
jgi:hypothetical protein